MKAVFTPEGRATGNESKREKGWQPGGEGGERKFWRGAG